MWIYFAVGAALGALSIIRNYKSLGYEFSRTPIAAASAFVSAAALSSVFYGLILLVIGEFMAGPLLELIEDTFF